MTAVVDGFRWSLLGIGSPVGNMMLASILMTVIIFVTGVIYFRHMEKTFADVV